MIWAPWVFGISWVGIAFMLALEIPNILWTANKPAGYDPSNENKILRGFERVGQVLCTATIILFSNTNPHGWNPWIAWLIAAIILMVLYECYWIRYFRSSLTLHDFYRPFLGVPAPGATLPVVAFLLLGIYGRFVPLIVSAIILGIGHIGIHLQHIRELKHSAPPIDIR